MKFPLTPPFSRGQAIALSVIPKISSLLSTGGSLFILQHILRGKKRHGVFQRVMMMKNIFDIVFSIKFFVSTWILPRGSHNEAIGNIGTCTAAGLIGHGAAVSTILYNGSLAFYYVLAIPLGWKDEEIRKSRLEVAMHAVPIIVAWSIAITGLPLTLYNPVGFTCWIGSVPPNCKDSYRFGDEANCERGDNAWIYRWAFWYAELFTTWIFQIICMYQIYKFVLKTEVRTDRYQFGQKSSNFQKQSSQFNIEGAREGQSMTVNDRKHSRAFADQAMFYVLISILTWIGPMIGHVTQQITGEVYTILLLLNSTLAPLQGFNDFLVYARPIYIRYKKKKARGRLARSTNVGSVRTTGVAFTSRTQQQESGCVFETDCNRGSFEMDKNPEPFLDPN